MISLVNLNFYVRIGFYIGFKGETELESDIDGVSVIPDASQSTVADNDDRNDFINESIQIENAAMAMKMVSFKILTLNRCNGVTFTCESMDWTDY